MKEYVALGGLPLAVIDNATGTPVMYAVHTDHLGTPRIMTDATGAEVWRIDARPFGETVAITGTAANDNRFPGQVFDAESGLHYNYFRDYDPTLGRYLQSDPIGLGGGLNTYAYVGGNPLSYTDPLGLWPWYMEDPTPEDKANWQQWLKHYVPELSDEEAEEVVDACIDELSTGDVAVGASLFSSQPNSLSEMNDKQKAFVKKFLERLPVTNGAAIDQIISSME